MKGFVNAEGNAWSKLISDLESEASRRYAFGEDVELLEPDESLQDIPLDDALTKIGDAMERWVEDSEEGDKVLIITDNVVDYGSTDAVAAQQLFYAHLVGSESKVSHIALLVLRLPFNGRIYPLRGGGSSEYSGDRALVLYAFSRHNEVGFDALVGRVRDELDSLRLEYHVIRVKPFDKSSFRTLRPGKGFPIKVPDALKNKIAIQNGKIWIRNLDVGDNIEFPLEVEIRSDSSFALNDVHAKATIHFPDQEQAPGQLVREGDFETEISPSIADIPAGGSQLFTVTVKGSKFTLPSEKGVLERAVMALGKSQPISGKLTVRFLANMSNVDLSAGLLEEWSHDKDADLGNPEAARVHDRVYMMEPLVMGLMPTDRTREEELLDENLGIRIDLSYPLAPLLGILFLLILLVVLLFLLFKWLSRRREFLLADEYGAERRFTAKFLGVQSVYGEQSSRGKLAFKLMYLFFGFLVRPGSGYRIDGPTLISGRRDSIRVVPRGNDDFDIFVWELSSVEKTDAYGNPQPGGIWDENWGS